MDVPRSTGRPRTFDELLVSVPRPRAQEALHAAGLLAGREHWASAVARMSGVPVGALTVVSGLTAEAEEALARHGPVDRRYTSSSVRRPAERTSSLQQELNALIQDAGKAHANEWPASARVNCWMHWDRELQAGRSLAHDRVASLALFVASSALPDGQQPVVSVEEAERIGWHVLARCWDDAVRLAGDATTSARHRLASLSDDDRGHLVTDITPQAMPSHERSPLRALVAATLM